jgi:hypothetical protein
MNDTLLTDMERAGSVIAFTDATYEDRSRIALQLSALRAAGHAIIADETFSHEEKPILRVFHYKTCVECLRRK